MECLGREAESTVPEDDHLFQIVGGGHPDMVLFSDSVGDLFDVGIRRLRLLGVDHKDVVVAQHIGGAPGDLVGIEHQDDHTFFIPLVVAKQIHQGLAGGVDAFLGQLFQLFPSE